jgi:ribonuclease-3
VFDFLLRPLRRNFGRDKEYYRQIDDMFGFIPNNIELYKLALIHKSASFVLPDGSQMNNERLEYLGDAIIEAVTSDYLYIEFPDKTEGFLTQLRSKIVSRHSLNMLAERIGLDRFLVAHAGATLAQKHIYGDAFEAMIGAIYLDQGYEFTNRLLINYIYANFLDMDSLSEEETDFKSRLIEWCQKNHHTIRFVTKHTSPTHFLSTIFIDDMEVSHGRGTSKKESEQHAAQTMAQTVTDSACLRMLDKLDKLDQQDTEPQPSAPKAKKAKPAEKSEPTTEAEKAKEPKRSKGAKPARGTKQEKVENPEEKEPTEEVAMPQAEEPEKATAPTESEEPRERRPRRRPKAKKEAVEEKSASTPESETVANAPQESPVLPEQASQEHATDAEEKPAKPKRSRTRRTPKREVKEGAEHPSQQEGTSESNSERASLDAPANEPRSSEAVTPEKSE